MSNVITYDRPRLYRKQSDAFFNDFRYSFIEGSTKSGKTVGCIAWLLEQALLFGRSGRHYWWVAPTFSQAKIAYGRMKRTLPIAMRKCNDSDLLIILPNGAAVQFKSGEKPDGLYGEDVWAAVIDEASRMREEAWFALRTTLTATKGKVRVIGNVKGRKNWFYKLCRRAESGDKEMYYSKITSIDAIKAGVLDYKEVMDAKMTLPRNIFMELYFCEASDDQGNPFGIKHIRQCVIPALTDLDPVRYGVDLAKSYDWTAIVGLDKDNNMCRFERFQKPWEDTFRYVLAYCGNTHTLVDSTGVGDPIVERLQKKSINGNFEGYHFNPKSKQKLMEGLSASIQSKEIGIADDTLINELESFEYEYTRTGVMYTAPQGTHDDCVMALSLANYGVTMTPNIVIPKVRR